jgi:hypothetical protein
MKEVKCIRSDTCLIECIHKTLHDSEDWLMNCGKWGECIQYDDKKDKEKIIRVRCEAVNE